MKKLLLPFSFLLCCFTMNAQTWKKVQKPQAAPSELIRTNDYSSNQVFLQFDPTNLKNQLLSAQKRNTGKPGVLITMPTITGDQQFLVWEKSNFSPALQAKYPQIRAYYGIGVNDSSSALYFSLSPSGIETMLMKGGNTQFIEPYTKDASVYVLFESANRSPGTMPLVCNTEEKALASKTHTSVTRSNTGTFRTFRLALSCTGEYGAYHGGTVTGALAAMNATMTRVNGVYDIDLAVELIMIANDDAVVYTDAASDPYSDAANMSNWNGELQNNLTSVIGEENYDIGHLFGATGGGGNAGCIGCVCEDGSKGSGITSPADGVPQGDNFDIDYVAHEMGHQLGGTHTFSYNVEGSGTNIEPGSGSTIMAYAGITGSYDVQAHSDDYFAYASVQQIQDNLEGKSCAVTSSINNNAPVVNAGPDYVIPKGTPFILTGSATDAENDSLTYCWEQFDDAGSLSGNNSFASATKASGPTFRSFSPTAVPIRYFPALTRVKANSLTSNFESVSNVARPLNFTLTVRDNSANGGQTATDAVLLNVSTAAGPFLVTAPNTTTAIQAGSNVTVTWNVAGTDANGVNSKFVDIYLSADAAVTFPTLLASNVPNDGSEIVTMPETAGSGRRIMVRSHDNIFFDISNANFSTSAAGVTQSIAFSGVAGDQNKTACGNETSISYTFKYNAIGGYTTPTTFSATGNPDGTTVSFNPATMTASGNVTMTVSNLGSGASGFYTIAITSTSGTITKTFNSYLKLGNPAVTLASPADNAYGVSPSATLTWNASPVADQYLVQVATDEAFTNIINTATVTGNTFVASGLSELTTYYWRVQGSNASCTGNFSSTFRFTTGQLSCAVSSSTTVVTISSTGTPTVTSTINIPTGVTIADINATVKINHTYVSDLTVNLISPAGTSVTLLSGVCEDKNNINATFDDSGNDLVCSSGSPVVSGTIKPKVALSAFAGQSSAGTWTLQVSDSTSGDGGSIQSWSLNICQAIIPLGVTENEKLDFSVYPNPNNGSFTIQSGKVVSDKVKVAVYDMQGRQIFNKDFDGTGTFNQNIQLDNAAAGVYLLSVTDGERKDVKRIVIQ